MGWWVQSGVLVCPRTIIMSRYSSIQKYNPFQITIDPSIAGTSGIGKFQLPLSSTAGRDYRFRVDWGDGTEDRITDYSDPLSTHTYSGATSADTKTIKIYGKFDKYDGSNSAEDDKLLSIDSWGNVYLEEPRFEGSSNLTGMTTDIPILEKAQVLGGMFKGCSSFNKDIGDWDVSKSTNFGRMFESASDFNNGGSPSISGWSTTNVTSTYQTFWGCTDFNQPIGSWDVSKSTHMQYLFRNCTNFNQPLGDWDVSSVTSNNGMFGVFYGCSNFDQDIGSWDVSNVKDMQFMFSFATNFNNGGSPSISGWTLSSIQADNNAFQYMFRNATSFNQPIGSWDVSTPKYFERMFRSALAFNQDLGDWDMSNTISCREMFTSATNFNNGGLPSISGWTTSSITNMSGMFSNTSFNQPIGNWVVSGVTDMGSMFPSTPFNQDIGDWDVSGVNTMSSMFSDNSVFNQDIGDWVVGGVTTMSNMFSAASDFNNGGSPSISGWTIGSSSNMSNMFANTSFNQPIGNWVVSGVTDMVQMFLRCPFNQDISTWDVGNVTNISGMFSHNGEVVPGQFNQDLSLWDVRGKSNMNDVFNNQSGFTSDLSSWDVSDSTLMDRMFDDCSSFTSYLGGWNVSGVTTMSNMLDNTAITTAQYNDILTGWTGWNGTSYTKTLQPNVTFGVNGLTYSTGTTAEQARTYLLTGLTWTISGDIGI
jgi:surface protein